MTENKTGTAGMIWTSEGWAHVITEQISMRDQFAMAALPALIAKRDITKPWSEVPFNAYSIADMMLEARKEKK